MECEFQEIIQRDQSPEVGDRWGRCDRVDEEENITESHVVPIDDSDGHQWGLNCHCEPDIFYADDNGNSYGYPIIVHFAFDGRHVVEEANSILS